MARYAEDERRANGPVWGLGGKLRVDNTRAELQSLGVSGLERDNREGGHLLWEQHVQSYIVDKCGSTGKGEVGNHQEGGWGG